LETPKPIFIVGAPRSGTSLTRDLVRNFGGVYLPPDEIQVLPIFARKVAAGLSVSELYEFVDGTVFAGHMRRRGLWPDRLAIETALVPDEPAVSFRGLVLALAEVEGLATPVYWGDKTPENVFAIDLILQLWPDSKVLFVIRDPRNTVLSMNRAWGRSIVRGATLWRDSVLVASSAAARMSPASFFKLRYEDLTSDPKRVLLAVAKWLDVDFDPSHLDSYQSEERWGEASGMPGVHSNLGGWENKLTRKQVYEVEKITYNTMIAECYQPRYASKSSEPSNLKLRILKLLDGLAVLNAYSRERGLKAAFEYKLKQWKANW
jgi:hypothetical protein